MLLLRGGASQRELDQLHAIASCRSRRRLISFMLLLHVRSRGARKLQPGELGGSDFGPWRLRFPRGSVGNRGVGNLRLIGLVGLGPASRVFTFHLDSLLTTTTCWKRGTYAHTYAHTYTPVVSYFRSGRSRLGARGIYPSSHFFLPP